MSVGRGSVGACSRIYVCFLKVTHDRGSKSIGEVSLGIAVRLAPRHDIIRGRRPAPALTRSTGFFSPSLALFRRIVSSSFLPSPTDRNGSSRHFCFITSKNRVSNFTSPSIDYLYCIKHTHMHVYACIYGERRLTAAVNLVAAVSSWVNVLGCPQNIIIIIIITSTFRGYCRKYLFRKKSNIPSSSMFPIINELRIETTMQQVE